MYNAKYVIPGLAVFVGIFTMPFWLNFGSEEYRYPEVALPKGQIVIDGQSVDAGAACIEPKEWMRANHMGNQPAEYLHGLPRRQGSLLRQMP